MAVSGFKGVGWLLGIAVVSPTCYMVSSGVAAERGRVEAVEMAILDARRDIRTLETEFDTRANLAQLERWNGEVLSLSAPRPEQYLASDAALASLRPLEGAQHYAALVVPSATDVALAEVKPVEQPVVKLAIPKPPEVLRVATAPATPAPSAAPVSRATLQKAVATTAMVATAKPRLQKVAMVDDKLLSDATFGDLVSSARSERARLR